MSRRDKEVQAYAQALFEAIVEEALGALRTVQQRLREDEDLRALLEDPARDVAEKYAALQQVLPEGTPQAVAKFLGLLISRQDLGYLDEIIRDVQQDVLVRGQGVKVAEVTSAVPLTDEERAQLEAKVRERFGENVRFTYRVDPEILGGLIVRVGDTLLDYSLRSRLEALRQRVQALV